MPSIEPGLTYETTHRVGERHLATTWDSGLAAVLATPALIAFCEACARRAVDPLLPEGQQTVGTRIDLRHRAATPPDMEVTVRVELIEIEGRRLCFRVEARDEVELVGEGEHERFIVDAERFQRGVADKARR